MCFLLSAIPEPKEIDVQFNKLTAKERKDYAASKQLTRLICALLAKNPHMTTREAQREARTALKMHNPTPPKPAAQTTPLVRGPKWRGCCASKRGACHLTGCVNYEHALEVQRTAPTNRKTLTMRGQTARSGADRSGGTGQRNR